MRKTPEKFFEKIIKDTFSEEKITDNFSLRAMGLIDDEKVGEFFIKTSGEVINSDDLELKENFVSLLSGYLGFEKSPFFFISRILDFLNINLYEFSNKYPTLNMYLSSQYVDDKEKLNISIRILLLFLKGDGNYKPKFKKLENELNLELFSILSILSEDGSKIGNYSKIKIILLIKLIGEHVRFSKKIIGELFETLSTFLSNELLKFLQEDENDIKKIGFNKSKNFIIRDEEENSHGIEEINSMISNGNFTKNPIIIVFRSFPGNETKVLVYQQQELFSFKNTEKFKVFNQDKNAFLEELSRCSKYFTYNIPTGDIFSISVFVKRGKNGNPPHISQLSDLNLNASNDNLLEAKAA